MRAVAGSIYFNKFLIAQDIHLCCQPKISESHPAPHPGQQSSFIHLLTHLLIHGRPAWSVSEAVSRPNWHVTLTSTACVHHLTSWAYCLTATALNSTATWCDCLLVRVMSCGPGARRKQGWASMEMPSCPAQHDSKDSQTSHACRLRRGLL